MASLPTRFVPKFALSTALVISITAGLLLYVNLTVRECFFIPDKGWWTARLVPCIKKGWPLISDSLHKPHYSGVNLEIAVLIVAALALYWERCVVRSSKKMRSLRPLVVFAIWAAIVISFTPVSKPSPEKYLVIAKFKSTDIKDDEMQNLYLALQGTDWYTDETFQKVCVLPADEASAVHTIEKGTDNHILVVQLTTPAEILMP